MRGCSPTFNSFCLRDDAAALSAMHEDRRIGPSMQRLLSRGFLTASFCHCLLYLCTHTNTYLHRTLLEFSKCHHAFPAVAVVCCPFLVVNEAEVTVTVTIT